MNTEILTNNGVNIESALEFLGDIEMYNDTAKDFLQESTTRIPNITGYLNSNDIENYTILVHAIKSDSKYLGFTKLAELAYNHEMAGKSNDVNYIKENLDSLLDEMNRIINLIHEYIGE